jgi:dolichyl-phosphate beta-glucosyltransferase
MVSIIIAAYNEEKRIGRSLESIRAHMDGLGFDYEVIVVDDGSTDATCQKVLAFKSAIARLEVIGCKVNRGKGHALRTGVLASQGDFVLLTDADLSTPIEELSRLMPPVLRNECQVAIGSRSLALSKIVKKQPWWRQGMGKIFNGFVRRLVINDFSDTQCGFKLFAGEVARQLFREAKIDRFAFDVEILALAKLYGYRILEVPIRWINAPGSKVNPIFDSIQMLCDLVRIRFALGKASRQSPVNAVTSPNHPRVAAPSVK